MQGDCAGRMCRVTVQVDCAGRLCRVTVQISRAHRSSSRAAARPPRAQRPAAAPELPVNITARAGKNQAGMLSWGPRGDGFEFVRPTAATHVENATAAARTGGGHRVEPSGGVPHPDPNRHDCARHTKEMITAQPQRWHAGGYDRVWPSLWCGQTATKEMTCGRRRQA